MYKIDKNNSSLCSSMFLGYFENGNAKGSGVYIFEDGSYFDGNFLNNFPSGKGLYYTKASNQTFLINI